MASPMLDSRSPRVLDPHKKAHFNLHISDRITKSDSSAPSFSAVKYNHKPPQTAETRTATLKPSANDTYKLQLEDKDPGRNPDIFTFTGQRTVPKKSYILLFDQSAQKCTLEPLSSTYTFNLQSRNTSDISSSHPKIYPKKSKDDDADTRRAGGDDTDDLFDANPDDADDEPDPDNPYDFRHFLKRTEKEKEKRGYDSETQFQSSPDYRTGTGSAYNTPVLPAARKTLSSTTSTTSAKTKPTSQPASSTAAKPKPRKRKSPDADPLVAHKPSTMKKQTQTKTQTQQPAPTVRLDRAATGTTKSSTSTSARKPGPKGPAASKIKSAEIVHSSSESDIDAEGEPDSPALAASPPTQPARYAASSSESDEDSDTGPTGLEIEVEVPDVRSTRAPKTTALSSLGLGQSIGLGAGSLSHLPQSRKGPISLASAANSVEGSPNRGSVAFGTPRKPRVGRRLEEEDGVIDFGNLGGGDDDDEDADGDAEVEEDGGYIEDEEDGDGDVDADADADEEMEAYDRDVEPMDLGPPAQAAQEQNDVTAGSHARKLSLSGALEEAFNNDNDNDEEDDPLYKEMMEGLAGGDSSEESEEE